MGKCSATGNLFAGKQAGNATRTAEIMVWQAV
jgi:hypothetical protein